MSATSVRQPNRVVAAVLSLLIPGAGQLYKGRPGNGLFWLVLVACLWFAAWPLAVVVHLVCIYDAAQSS